MTVDRQGVSMKSILRKSFGLLDGFQLLTQRLLTGFFIRGKLWFSIEGLKFFQCRTPFRNTADQPPALLALTETRVVNLPRTLRSPVDFRQV